jgi:hypothetical protein
MPPRADLQRPTQPTPRPPVPDQQSLMSRPGCSHCTSFRAPALWITGPTGCNSCTASRARGAISALTGCNRRSDGVQRLHPNRTWNHPRSRPPPPRARARGPARRADPGAAGVGEPMSEFFVALGDSWRLTAAQRARLTPAVTAALTAGWTPGALAAFAGANTDGVRNPYAVLAARLSGAELPPPPARSPRPAWCGECDQGTRMLDFDGDAPRPCPRCKPPSPPATGVPLRRLS